MIFVTGGAGLVGAALLKQLVQSNQGPVKALYRSNMPVTLTEEEKSRVEWIKGDVLDTGLLDEVLKDCKQVYHSAAVVSFHKSRRENMYRINIEGTANIVNACLNNQVEKLVHVSSVAALGRIRKGETVNENTKWSEETNNSHYGKTKYLSELEVWRGMSEGLNAAIVNPSIIIGEAPWETGSMAIFKKAWEEFPYYTTGSTGYVDAKDVAAAMIALMNSNITAERFILCNEHRSFKDLLTLIATHFNKKPPYKKPAKWMMDLIWRIEAVKSKISGKEPLLTKETVKTSQSATLYDHSKIKKALPGFEFTPLNETVERSCNWLKDYYHLS
ncbi:MAG: NAD-dependent epimerase/dehydratase family protein [Chitinophagaceae bacterium]